MILHALSASYKDVNDQLIAAHDGDTIVIPGGPAVHWNQRLLVTKAITIQGATTISNAGAHIPTANDQTIIINDNPSTAADIVNVNIGGGKSFHLSGITFQVGTNTGDVLSLTGGGGGSAATHQIDNCHFIDFRGRAVQLAGWVYGVAHHCWLEAQGNGQCFYFNMPTYNGKLLGHGQWADFPYYGTERFFFVEDTTMSGNGIAATSGASDAENGGRGVFRHCYFINCRPGWHGTEGGNRGARCFEIYNNTFNWSIQPSSLNRSGTAFYHDNNWVGVAPANDQHSSIQIFREEAGVSAGCPYGQADGTGLFDKNDTEGNGTFVEGHSPHLYESGTVTSATNGSASATLTDTSKTWTPGQWVGFWVKQTKSSAASYPKGSHIIANDAHTITYVRYVTGDRGPTLAFAASDTYQIHKLLRALDQGGSGKGDLLSGNLTPVNTVAGHTWAHQAIEPMMSWNNEHSNGTALGFATQMPTEVSGVDFINLGKGKVTNGAPTEVTSLYVAALNGVNYTQPFTYPHPLIANVPIISSQATASFTELVLGSFQVLTTGFSGSVTFSKQSGTLPTGVTLNSSGLLAGTPQAGTAGQYNFVIAATDGSDSDTQSFTLTVSAAGTKIIALSGSMDFGLVTVGTSATKNLTITNNGNTVLTVSGITYPTGFGGNWAGGTIAVGASHVVAVTFSPASGISYSGTITVASDKTSGTNTTSALGTGATRVIAISGSLSFGSITTGQTATRSVTVSNSGTAPMTVSSVTYPEGFSGNYSGGSIAAGGSVVVDVTFSPLLAQAYSGDVTFGTDKTSGTAFVAATGTGTASATKIIQLTGSLAYGSVQTGTSLSKALTITNSGNATLTVTDVTVPSGYTPDWTSGTIAAGASQVVNITFSPVAVTSYNGTVTVSSDATGGTSTHAISGAGVSASTRIIALSGNMAFGNVLIGSTNGRTLTITNSGSAVMTVTGITLPTGFSGDFSGTIAAGASQDVTITFSPLAAQLYSGTITVASDKTSGTATMAISGTGVVPTTRIIGLTGNLAFGNVVKNHNTQKTLTITNSGTAALSITSITYPTGFTGDFASGSIAAGASQNVVVTFRPTAAGSYGGVITVASNKTSGLDTINCSGTGVNKKQVPFILIVG